MNNDLSIVTLNFNSIIMSFIFSYLTIKFFLEYVKKASLNIFVIIQGITRLDHTELCLFNITIE